MSSLFFLGGIKNRGCTCYISSALQVILRYSPFHHAMKQLSKELPDVDLFKIIYDLSRQLKMSKDPVNPDSLINYFRINAGKTADICEFLTTLLDHVIEIGGEQSKRLIEPIFYSQLFTNKKNDPVIFVTVPVVENANVTDLLPETFTKQGQMIFIHITRMTFKCNKVIKDESLMRYDPQIKINGYEYKLYAVVQHLGDPELGHYRVYLQDKDGWILANDSLVQNVETNEVFNFAKQRQEHVYVLVYILDISKVRTIRIIKKFDDYTIKMKLWDSQKWKVVSKMQFKSEGLSDARDFARDIKTGWEQAYGKLRIRYKVNNKILEESFPTNVAPCKITGWAELAHLSRMNPKVCKLEFIGVIISIAKTSIGFLINFIKEQTFRDVKFYCHRFIQETLESSAKVKIYIWTQFGLITCNNDKITLYELYIMLIDNFKIFIYLDDTEPEQNEFYTVKMDLVQAIPYYKNLDTKIEHIVDVEDDVDTLIKLGCKNLKCDSCDLFSIPQHFSMIEIKNRKIKLVSDKFYQYTNLRIQNRADPHSLTCTLVENHLLKQPLNLTFKFPFYAGENVINTEKRMKNYLQSVEDVKIMFKIKGKKKFRPEIPYNDISNESPKLVVLVSKVQE